MGPFFKTKLIKKIKKLEKQSNNLKIVKFKNSLIKYLSCSDMIIIILEFQNMRVFLPKPVMVIYENKKLLKMNKDFIEKISL